VRDVNIRRDAAAGCRRAGGAENDLDRSGEGGAGGVAQRPAATSTSAAASATARRSVFTTRSYCVGNSVLVP